jgi:hypothetical protein
MDRTPSRRASSIASAAAAVLVVALGAACGSSEKSGPQDRVQLARIVTHSESRLLGFRADAPLSLHKGDSISLCPLVPPGLPAGLSYDIDVAGTASLRLAMGADFTFSYDKDQVVPGATLPVAVTYTPTPDGSPNARIHFSVTFTAKGCIKDCILPDFCDTVTFTCGFDAGPTAFTAPLGADAPVTVPVSSCTATLNVAGVVDIGSAHVEGSITLAPMPAGGLGIGGAVSAFGTTGPASPPLIPLLQWTSAATSQNANLSLANPLPGADHIGLDLSPVVHWLATSGDLKLVINLASGFHDVGISDPAPITFFSGNLGPIYTDIGLDTQVSNAVEAAVGFDPGFGPVIAAGNIPVPLTDPELQEISLGSPPTFGKVSFSFSTDVTPPTIVIVAPRAAPPYAHSDLLVLDYGITDPGGTGVDPATVSVLLDGSPMLAGHGLASGQAIPLLTEMTLGIHVFSIAAADFEHNAASQTVTFEIIVTPESIIADVDQLLAAGMIKNNGLANSLQAKLRAAAAARARGQCKTAGNIYEAFINELQAQTGKGVDPDAAALL